MKKKKSAEVNTKTPVSKGKRRRVPENMGVCRVNLLGLTDGKNLDTRPSLTPTYLCSEFSRGQISVVCIVLW